ncbi:DUF2750 domain-containing protein [Goodfellowiella coeruleoviolacea]|uniref:DUF2750 domain-containing protein n=1 Tax=Goodfellowiella coeruleoviolacea TaxID=334858 RepID=UPI0020A59251|nr:DUF2750 domain-containing protein [Goodfellowiella coeruleoviolacea]
MAQGFPELTAADLRQMSLSGKEREKYFLDRVLAQGAVCSWGLGEDTLLWEDEEGNTTIAFWSHPEFAARCYPEGERESGEGPIVISLDRWVNKVLPQLRDEGIRVGIFPVGDVFAVVADPGVLLRLVRRMVKR